MKVKVYRTWVAENPGRVYYVDAPSKRIAKWVGAGIHNNDYATFLGAKDMKAERFTVKECAND